MDAILSKPTLLKQASLAACAWLLAGAAFAQATVQLTASPTSTTLPDGQAVPMWGLFCNSPGSGGASCTTAKGPSTASPPAWASGTYAVGALAMDAAGTVAQVTTAGTSDATAPPFNPTVGGTTSDGSVVWTTFGTLAQFQASYSATWAPPVIRVAVGTPLTIHLVNKLSFTTPTAQQNNVPTSLVIVGQLGGGLGDSRATMPSPVHAPQGTTWPGTLGAIDPATAAITVSGGGAGYVLPPAVTISGGSGSGATAVATIANGVVTGVNVSSVGSGYTAPLTVAIDPPPCTINGTTCVQATATMSLTVLQSSDGSATFVPPAQADRVRSFATEVTVSDTAGVDLTWTGLRPGTYLIHSGTQPSIQHPMGLYGVLVVTETGAIPTAYGTNYDADVALLLSEIDPDQNRAVDQAVRTDGFSDALVWDGETGKCGDPAVHTCYPPAVNYSPLYYLVNGVSFDRTQIASSSIPVAASGAQTNVLLRFANAGLRLHVPAVVGANMTLLAEDGNKLPGTARVQASVALAAGKTFDVVIQPKQTNAGTYDAATYAVFDRQLSLSTANQRDGGMQVMINVAGGAGSGAPGTPSSGTTAQAVADTYNVVPGGTLTIADPAKGVMSNDKGIYGVAISGAAPAGLTFNANGTFTYANATPADLPVQFNYCGNGATSGAACTTVTLQACIGSCLADAPVANPIQFTSNVATRYSSPPPGVLAGVTNPSGLALTAIGTGLNPDGSFTVSGPGTACPTTLSPAAPTGATCVSFPYSVKNAQGTPSNTSTATVVFLQASNLVVNVWDAPSTAPGKTRAAITDYRWIIEEDRTFWIEPRCQVNVSPRPAGCPPLPVESLGYSFHTASMPVVAQGCVGAVSCEAGQTQGGAAVACDIGNGICRQATQKSEVLPSAVHLDPNKRYFISILPGDGVNPTIGGAGGPDANNQPFSIATTCGPYTGPTGAWEPAGTAALCGHAMGGSQIAAGQATVDIKLQQTPLPTAKIAVFVFQDDNPLNGENDAGGGVDVIAPNEAGLGGFEIKVFDQAGGLGDATGQITYDMFNQPVSNSLAGKIDPVTGLNACPITARGDGLVGMIPTCPKYESDGTTLSPLAGQVVIANLYPGLYEIVATPAADRIGRGEEWLQTNTLDGGKAHEAFIKPNEPGYFQEFGPGGFHVSIGFANPQIINNRKANFCRTSPTGCSATLTVQVTNAHMSRTPDQRTYSSETYDHYSFTQCYVSVGPADAEDFAFQKCNPDGTVTFTNMPTGVFKLTVFDQWNDIMLDGLVGTVTIDGSATPKIFPVTQWRTNLFTRTFIDQAGTGVSDGSQPGLALVNTNIHYRDGSIGFFNNTDLNGYAGFNEVFPFMNWLVVETTSTRHKPTAVHTVYDAGGPVDCSAQATALGMPCTTIAANIANTAVRVPLPADLRMPGAKYCDNADCPASDAGGGASTGTVFPPQAWGTTQGWQGLLGQNSFMEFGVKPFNEGENGGIQGQVIYASTRPFDDPSLSLQLSWEPGVPRVKVNLYSKSVDGSGNEILKLVDTTTTTSWDDWAQGFRRDGNGALVPAGTGANAGFVPNMNCPGQDATSPFFATLKDSKQWLDTPDSSGNKKALAYHSQFKCYDGWSQLNQVQPAPYDGLYKFPSVVTVDANGKPASTNCTGCMLNTKAAPGDWDYNKPMLPAGKYVVEVILPPGYELVKEEDKNILLGDVYIAPVVQQFAGFGNIFIMPDQAAVNAFYNPVNPGGLNKTTNLGASPRHEGDTGSVESFWPCVGAERIVPDLNSLYPGAGQAAPFAGAKRRLCDRKEVTLNDQASALAKFFIFSSTHVAGHFTGLMTNDFAAEFDPFSPQFGEKFGPPNLPVGMRDFAGNEVARVYADQWGVYNGLYFSTYGVNPPNPTGYVPQMAIACMNDPGPILDTRVGSPTYGTMITDPSYSPAYSNFCYETPFMPGFTAYMDTPVIPTMSFADGYNLPDTEYPDGTPAIKSVVSSAAQGPWVVAATPNQAASATVTFSNVAAGDTVTSVLAGSTVLTTAAITCNAASACSTLNNTGQRNNRMATLVAQNIAAHSGVSGFTATASNATVTITATTGGPGPNGTLVTVNQTGITVGGTLVFAGGSTLTAASMNLTITALGDKVVQNPNFSGPNASMAPFNQKTITRHYGFGNTAGSVAVVGSDGVVRPLTGVNWSDTTITGTVPTGLPNCKVQQLGQAVAQCGELMITAANGKRSIDAITVTVGGSAPWIVTESSVTAPSGKSAKDYGANFGRMGPSPIQVALDSAAPGDLILVQPGTYRENLIMWKPVRLQGVGAGAVTINADAHPAGKMDQWRRQVNCAFGLTLDGVPNLNNANFQGTDPTNSAYSCPAAMHQRVDRIPFEAIVGWDATGNGNLAQVLQEPSLMGAYEGAGITVLARGVRIPDNSTDFWGRNATGGPGAFTDGSVWLTDGTADCAANPAQIDGRDYGTSNFYCNPSRIDGVSVINSSQGGGGVFIHGWNHNLEVANTRISGNHGTVAGAINLGNGEIPDAYINDGVGCGVTPVVTPCPPVTWTDYNTNTVRYTPVTNAAIAFQFNTNVRIHHNMLYNNASIGDALFSGTPAGAGAITISSGADGYQIDHNWIAGNLSTGDGGGVQHLGLSFQGKINNNYVLFNQSTNPTLPTSGGGIVIEGANLDRILNGTECGSTNDQDCPPGLGEGTGFGLVIDANLILGNSAESGTGGGLRIQQVNASDYVTFSDNPDQWYDVTVTNNIIANNVAGWDGGGVSIQDAMKVTFVNNTVVSNDTTATAGVLFKTLGAIMANTPPPGCNPQTDPSLPQDPSCLGVDAPHGPQPAGLVAQAHTPNLIASLGPNTVCPNNYGYSQHLNGDCRALSKPRMANDIFFQNRAFRVDIVGLGQGLQSQQNLVALAPMLNQTSTGQCAAGANYWDVGLRTDDITAGQIPFGTTLAMTNSIITGDPQKVISADVSNIMGGSSPVIAQFCNGARTAPESCSQLAGGLGQSCNGYNAPPGSSETTGLPTLFVFNNIKPTATVDEGHNWLNLSFGPLTLNRTAVGQATTAPELMIAAAATGSAGGAYAIPGTSDAVNRGSNAAVNGVAPTTDFFGNPRPRSTANPVDIGAVEYPVVSGTLVVANPSPLAFADVVAGTGTATRDLVLTNNGTTTFAVPTPAFTGPFSRTGSGSFTNLPPNCGTSLTAGASCTIRVQWTVPTGVTTATGTVTITGVQHSPVPINANTVAATYTANVSPSALAFGNWATGTTSAPMFVMITNTGNSQLSSLAFGGIVAPFSRVTTGTFPVNAPNCGTTLAVGASCSVGVAFAPTAVRSYSANMTVTAANGAVISPLPVALTGAGVASRATVSIAPNPLTITLDSPTNTPTSPNLYSQTGIVTLTNTAAAGGSSVAVTSVTVNNTGGPGSFTKGQLAGPDNCTGTNLAPGASCTVSVRFSVSPNATRGGANGTATINFADTASGSPQQGQLIGVLTP